MPLTLLTTRSSYFSTLTDTPAEVLVVKSIRTYASDVLEVRMRTSQSSRSDNPKTDRGPFEVRLKDWKSVLTRNLGRSKHDWDDLTVYVVGSHVLLER